MPNSAIPQFHNSTIPKGDHSIIVRTNQVCHIPLLAGAAYTVESDLPISYSAVGVSFYVDSICYTNRKEWLDMRNERTNKCNILNRRGLANVSHDTGGLEIYFVDKVANGVSANHDTYGIVMSKNANALTLAHELGHAFGCADVYPCMKRQPDIHIPDSALSESHAPLDWNNGTGYRYYKATNDQGQLIERLLMCGNGKQGRRDISSGSIYGFTEDGDDGLVDVGFFRSGVRRGIILHR